LSVKSVKDNAKAVIDQFEGDAIKVDEKILEHRASRAKLSSMV
jgi:hypothetical protein